MNSIEWIMGMMRMGQFGRERRQRIRGNREVLMVNRVLVRVEIRQEIEGITMAPNRSVREQEITIPFELNMTQLANALLGHVADEIKLIEEQREDDRYAPKNKV